MCGLGFPLTCHPEDAPACVIHKNHSEAGLEVCVPCVAVGSRGRIPPVGPTHGRELAARDASDQHRQPRICPHARGALPHFLCAHEARPLDGSPSFATWLHGYATFGPGRVFFAHFLQWRSQLEGSASVQTRPHSILLAQAPVHGDDVGLDRERAALMTGQWSASWDLPDILRLENEDQYGDALHSTALHTGSRQYNNFDQ